MSKNTLQIFLLLLKNGKWCKILKEYYRPNTCIECKDDDCNDEKDITWLMQRLASSEGLLQHTVDKIKVIENRLSFTIYTVSRDINNQIDMEEHKITSFWKNNKIQKHKHSLSNY
ncbi:hypothetical protein Q2T40_16080 [Winogradskyella maritima]|uniref:Uncharacterized protein n=1 Tax=Winogradskyella maritima TaxID=1517766 RepID=A0ABV8AFQ8_9FLAO|nr:hypothetical protein [Winogradskyella maritima]